MQGSICQGHPFCASLFVAIPTVVGQKVSHDAATDHDLIRLLRISDTLRFYSTGKWFLGNTLSEWVVLMNEVATNYFAAQGITVKYFPAKLQMADGSFLRYFIYQLSGNPDGAAFSRLLYALQTKFKFADYPVRVFLDPLLEDGIYGQNIGSAISLSANALLTNRLGLHRVFRHELEHYFGALKIRRGENSLQRLSFEGGREVSKLEIYSARFYVDEIEAYYRDLNTGPFAKSGAEVRAQLLTDGFFAKTHALEFLSHEQLLPEIMTEIQATNGSFLTLTIERSLRGIDEIERQIQKSRGLFGWLNKTIPYEREGNSWRFKMPEDFPYEIFVVDLSGMMKVENPSRRQIENSTLEILKWSRARILRIQELAKRLPPSTTTAP